MTRKLWNYIPANQEKVDDLHQKLGIHPIFCRLLVQKGIENAEDARFFFKPDLNLIHDPFLMKDMDRAVERLAHALETGEKILLYGDYDVDGATAVALMYSYLGQIGAALDYYIPDRYKEGYGVSFEGIEYARDNGVDLILAMDCGITAVKQADMARLFGIDMIICDHHLPESRLPDAVAVLDPKRPGCCYPFKELSGCGVAFKLAQALSIRRGTGLEPLKDLLDLLAISIAADIVPMEGENRIFTYFGLQLLNKGKRPGLSALVKESKRNYPLSVNDIVYGIAPMLNAAGRLADADAAVKLLLAREKSVASDLAKVLSQRNLLRRDFDRRTTEEAIEAFLGLEGWEDRKSLVLFQPHWHKGIAGIVASRMVEQFYRPAIILTQSEGRITGSARSVKDFDLYSALKACEDLLINFGGHSHAAGLSLFQENLQVFQNRFEAIVQLNLRPDQLAEQIPIAGDLDLADITFKFWRGLSQFAPFGPGNRQPVFVSKQVRDTGYSALLKDNHLQISIKQSRDLSIGGIGFGLGNYFDRVKTGQPFDICYTVQEDTWKGQARIRLMVKDLKFE